MSYRFWKRDPKLIKMKTFLTSWDRRRLSEPCWLGSQTASASSWRRAEVLQKKYNFINLGRLWKEQVVEADMQICNAYNLFRLKRMWILLAYLVLASKWIRHKPAQIIPRCPKTGKPEITEKKLHKKNKKSLEIICHFIASSVTDVGGFLSKYGINFCFVGLTKMSAS